MNAAPMVKRVLNLRYLQFKERHGDEFGKGKKAPGAAFFNR